MSGGRHRFKRILARVPSCTTLHENVLDQYSCAGGCAIGTLLTWDGVECLQQASGKVEDACQLRIIFPRTSQSSKPPQPHEQIQKTNILICWGWVGIRKRKTRAPKIPRHRRSCTKTFPPNACLKTSLRDQTGGCDHSDCRSVYTVGQLSLLYELVAQLLL